MRLSIHQSVVLVLSQLTVVAGLSVLSGCARSESPQSDSAAKSPPATAPDDLHDVPISAEDVARPANYAEAVQRIQDYRDQIQQHTTSSEPAKAHRALDELNFVLLWLPEIARDSNVPRDQWETINVSAQRLRELFDQVHSRIDQHQNPDYASIADEVDQTITKLESIAVTSSSEAGSPASDVTTPEEMP